MDGASTILTDAHLQQINDALAKAEVAKKEIALAKRAGLDMAQQEADLNKGIAQLQQIKSVYFPNRA